MLDKIKCWFWYSLLASFWITWLPLIVWWFVPELGGAYFSTVFFVKLDHLGNDTYSFLSTCHGVLLLIVYFASLKELFDGYGILNREVTKWSVGLGEHTSKREKRRAKRAITWGVSAFVVFKSYIPGILTVSGITNGLFYWIALESTKKATVSAGIFFVLAFFISNLCGDYDEKINRIRDTIDYEFRNRSRYHGMREYIEDSDPYYREPVAPPPPRRQRRQQQPRYSRSPRPFQGQQQRPPLRRRPPEPPPEPLYYEDQYQDYYDPQESQGYQEPQPYQSSQPYQSPQPEQYYQEQQNQPDSFEDVLGDVPPSSPPRRQRQSGSQSSITAQLGKFFKHNKKRPF